MTFDAESLIKSAIAFAREFLTSPKARTDLDAIQAADELLGEFETLLARPENKARLAKIGKAALQDLPGLTQSAPAPMPVDAPQPEIQDGVRGGPNGGRMSFDQ